jgi:hypothetical protein
VYCAQGTPNSSVGMPHTVSSKQRVEENVVKKKDVRLADRTPGKFLIFNFLTAEQACLRASSNVL